MGKKRRGWVLDLCVDMGTELGLIIALLWHFCAMLGVSRALSIE